MATATKNYATKTVTELQNITLTLTPEEAAVIYILTGTLCGGGAIRKANSKVYGALEALREERFLRSYLSSRILSATAFSNRDSQEADAEFKRVVSAFGGEEE